MTREEAIEFYNEHKSYFDYNFFLTDYTSNSEGITISLYLNKRNKVLLDSYKFNLVRNQWVNTTTRNLDSLFVSKNISRQIEAKKYNMKIDYIVSGKLDKTYNKISRFNELNNEVSSKYGLEFEKLKEKLNEVFLIFDDSYNTTTTFIDINFNKLNSWFGKTIFNFTEIDIDIALKDIKLTIETKLKAYENNSTQTIIQNKLNELEYYYTIRTEFIHRFLFFLNTQGYELISFSEKEDFSKSNKFIISSSIKKK